MTSDLEQSLGAIRREEEALKLGGGLAAIERQHARGRLSVRERIDQLLDASTEFFELGLWAAWGMYQEWGGAPSAGVVTGIGTVSERRVMVIAHDATVKARGFFPMICKKGQHAPRDPLEKRLPVMSLVEPARGF